MNTSCESCEYRRILDQTGRAMLEHDISAKQEAVRTLLDRAAGRFGPDVIEFLAAYHKELDEMLHE